MDKSIQDDIDKAWELEQGRTAGFIQKESQRAAENAAVSGIWNPIAAASLFADRMIVLHREKARNLSDEVKSVFAAHGARPTDADIAMLRAKYLETLVAAAARAQAQLDRLKGDRGAGLIDHFKSEVPKIHDRSAYDFALMLRHIKNSPMTNALGHTVNIGSAQNVAVGDSNTQNAQTQFFEDLRAKIDASAAPQAEKDEAKSRLEKLLSHPLVVSIAGGLASGIAAGTK